MFTGIVEEIGNIESIQLGGNSSRLRVKADAVLEGTKVGDSICTNGVCLTVTSLEAGSFLADVMAETMRHSNLGNLRPGSKVNLERAVMPSGRLGGHLVSGHIDGIGVIQSMKREDNAIWISIEANENILRYIVSKGSIAVDGVSLTVARTEPWGLRVSIIPHTQTETLLTGKKAGDQVNLECDILAKYVERLMPNASTVLSEEFLKENGFTY